MQLKPILDDVAGVSQISSCHEQTQYTSLLFSFILVYSLLQRDLTIQNMFTILSLLALGSCVLCDLDFSNKFYSPSPRKLYMKFGYNGPSIFLGDV